MKDSSGRLEKRKAALKQECANKICQETCHQQNIEGKGKKMVGTLCSTM